MTMNEKQRNGRTRLVLRLALAIQSFREADAMAEIILSSKLEPGSHGYHGSVTGLAVSYCRPFMQADGLGSIHKDFESFSEAGKDATVFEAIHQDILTFRNRIAAHHDLEYADGEFQKKNLPHDPSSFVLKLGRKDYAVGSKHTTLPPWRIGEAQKLLTFQIARAQQALSSVVISIAKENADSLRANGGELDLVFRAIKGV